MNSPLTIPQQEIINKSKLLVVGAGGIGCELLKNLALSGFKNIETIDLDTIDVSNLNRQFLFQKIHVGQPKALIASESVKTLAGKSLKIEPFHNSIFEVKYNKAYFEQFDLVLNALDNLAARRHVNRICMSGNIPLVESGSAGYLGQSYPIIKSKTECFDCRPKPKRKTYPACTIRNTPSEPVHCIVWAKYLFNQLFGEEDADQDVSPEAEEEEEVVDGIKPQADETKTPKLSTRAWVEKEEYNCEKLFNKFYNIDVTTLLSMSSLWEKREKPNILSWTTTSNTEHLETRKIPNIDQLINLFNSSIKNIYKKYLEGNKEPLSWDKDDKEALNFVVAAANLRAMVFNIPLKSIWDIKSIAGNIIPAIASTNAMVAGLLVLQAVALLTRPKEHEKTGYRQIIVQNIGPKRIMTNMTAMPNEDCFVCRDKATATIMVDFTKTSLKEFKEQLIQKELALQQPDVRIGDSCVLIDADDDEPDADFLNQKLSDFELCVNGCTMMIEDWLQDLEIEVTLLEKPKDADFEENYKVLTKKESVESRPKLLKETVVENIDLENGKCVIESNGCKNGVIEADSVDAEPAKKKLKIE